MSSKIPYDINFIDIDDLLIEMKTRGRLSLTNEDINKLKNKDFKFSRNKSILLANYVDFSIYSNYDETFFRVEDNQEIDLEEIEAEIFSSLEEVVSRLSTYITNEFKEKGL